ncbi:class I SAM-dependent RNA methyltransferase [Nocardia sp. NPDC020380]|uniref:class I SAM-dependent RNA methyltransferase n=1 Tax=Nocardia sp. NPDC020380 TaxID=3364309 RepID=UPI0037BDD2EF
MATRLSASLTGASTAAASNAGIEHEAAPADRRASGSRRASQADTDPSALGERAGDAASVGPSAGQDGASRAEDIAASGASASHASAAVRPELSGISVSGAAGDASVAGAADYSGGWRSRMRLVVDAEGRAGVHRYRSTDVIADLRCPQPIAGAMDGIAARHWTPGADLVVAVDGDGVRHIVEIAPAGPQLGDDRRGTNRGRGGRSGGGRGSAGDRRHTASRRAAAHSARSERVVEGTGRAVQYVAGRRWELSATGFWQPHFGAAQCYSDVVAEWSDARPGSLTWDLYCGVGVFAARLADQVGPEGQVHGVEFSRPAISDGRASLGDMPWVDLRAERVERWITEQPSAAPDVVVLDPPRAGAGKEVIAALTERDPRRIIHIGCDPAAFARDLGLYRNAGYQPRELRVFDAFPATHHVECVVLLER